jgi:Uma2 family endonuclease
MATALSKRMSLAEFLVWDDGTDRRYELVDGSVFAMAPPAGAHAVIVVNLARQLGNRLKPPCYAAAEAGVVPPDRADTWFQADLVVTCAPLSPGARWFPEPVLIAEVLSPSTTVHDLKTKLPDYQRMPSVREILLISSEERRIERWLRESDGWRHEVYTAKSDVPVTCVNDAIPLADVYANLPL